jgi:hypothetical protein
MNAKRRDRRRADARSARTRATPPRQRIRPTSTPRPPGSTARWRLATLAAIAVLLVSGTAAYLVHSRATREHTVTNAPAQSTMALSAVEGVPRIVFRNTAIGPDYGRVAMVPLAAPDGARAFTSHSCDRVFASAGRTLCLASDPGVVTTYTATTWLNAGGPVQDLPLTGFPSRARLSDDGKLAATTSFVSGDSYAAGNFSTRTIVSELASGRTVDLENFRLIHEGKSIKPTDRNYWGVTFAKDDDSFYVTVKFGGTTWLAHGSLAKRTIQTIRSDAECPSLSPDGTRVAYKKLGDRGPGDWRLAVLDIKSGTETQLTEQRSVDDQVEWLDDSRILYGMPGVGSKAAETNVWVVPADGTGAPKLLIPQAWSPAVLH